MDTQKALMPVTPMRSPVNTRRSDTEDLKIHSIHSLNLRLQIKLHNSENEVGRLREEVQCYKGKSFIYESLTKDLATLRTQLDKTALALLKKCEAYDSLKQELTALKLQYNISPKSSSRQIPKTLSSPQQQSSGNVKRKLAIYHDIMSMSDNECLSPKKNSGRPSMGSCGNIANQISTEDMMPSCLKLYQTSTAPLRNRVLMKLHTLKSASTESLESVGRKSLKAQEAKVKPVKSAAQTKKVKPNLDSSLHSVKGSIVKGPPSIRPALGQNNGRVVKLNTSLKKSNSSCSSKSGGSSKPAFRF